MGVGMSGLKIIHLESNPDLCTSSYEEAKKLLSDDLPILLIHPPGMEDVIDYLWKYHRVTTSVMAPAEILKNDSSWALCGYQKIVVSIPGSITKDNKNC